MDRGKCSIKVISHIKIEDHVEYLINIDSKSLGCNIFFTEKYSNLRALYELMKKEAKVKKFPSFPPNKLFGYEEEKFVIQRAKDLNSFFQEINTNQNYSKLPSFNKFIDSNIKKNALVKGEQNKSGESNIIGHIVHNTKYNQRSSLFGNSLFKTEKKNSIKNVGVGESVEKIAKKFVKLNYEIEIENKIKSEEEYKKVFDKIYFKINDDYNISCNNSDENFNFIGNNDNIIIKEENNINSYMKQNLEKFKNLSNLIEADNILLK
jgi:hypothetical protein